MSDAAAPSSCWPPRPGVERLLPGPHRPTGGRPSEVVPIVPARGASSTWAAAGVHAPSRRRASGRAAYDAAARRRRGGQPRRRTGARAGGLKGGVGTARPPLPGRDRRGRPGRRQRRRLGDRPVRPASSGRRGTAHGDLPALRRADPADLDAPRVEGRRDRLQPWPRSPPRSSRSPPSPPSSAQAYKVISIGHDGLARATDPSHRSSTATPSSLETRDGAHPEAFHTLETPQALADATAAAAGRRTGGGGPRRLPSPRAARGHPHPRSSRSSPDSRGIGCVSASGVDSPHVWWCRRRGAWGRPARLPHSGGRASTRPGSAARGCR